MINDIDSDTQLPWGALTYTRVYDASGWDYAYRIAGLHDAYSVETVSFIGNEPILNRTMRRDIDNDCVMQGGDTLALSERGLKRVRQMLRACPPDKPTRAAAK